MLSHLRAALRAIRPLIAMDSFSNARDQLGTRCGTVIFCIAACHHAGRDMSAMTTIATLLHKCARAFVRRIYAVEKVRARLRNERRATSQIVSLARISAK